MSRASKSARFLRLPDRYKPYDLAVNLVLIIAKHHLGDALVVESDGSIEQWAEAILICRCVLGFGSDFRLANHNGTRQGGWRD